MDIQSILNDMSGVGEDKDTILKMFKKLEEENKQLKKKYEVLNSVQEAFRKQLREEMNILLEGKKGLIDENKKLKEDMKLKDGRIDFLETVKVLDHKDPTHLENKKLKAENSAYLDIINDLGDYMARVDQNAVDVFNEITEDSEHVPSRTIE